MSKRGYLSNSRYNPNKISSYIIKVVHFLKNEKYSILPRVFDSKTKVRLSRIRASKNLIILFNKITLPKAIKFNHVNREFLIKFNGKKN